MIDAQLFTIPVATVLKVLLVASIGAFSGRFLFFPQYSTKGISAMTVKIFLPAMLMARMATDLTIDVLKSGYGWAILLCFIPMILGFSLTQFIFRHFIKEKELHGLFTLASSYHNVVSFGLGVTQSLSGPSWINAAAYGEFATIIFLWNLPHTLAIWSGGPWIVRRAKEDEVMTQYEKEVKEYEAKVEKRRNLEPIVSRSVTWNLPSSKDNLSSPNSNFASSPQILSSSEVLSPVSPSIQKENMPSLRKESPRHDEDELALMSIATEPAQIEIIYTGGNRKYESTDGVTSLITSPVKKGRHQNQRAKVPQEEEIKPPPLPNLPPRKEGIAAITEFLIETLTNVTILASLIGMFFGLVPPLHDLAVDSSIGVIFFGALTTMGAANVPLTLLQLGTSLTSPGGAKKRMIKESKTVVDPETGLSTILEVEVEAPSKGFIRDYIESLEVPPRFIFLVVLNKMIIVPAVFFAIFVFLREAKDIPFMGPLPRTKVFQLTVLIESCAPTAINTVNLCALYQYKTVAYSQALLGIYVCAIFTTAFWLSLYLWYLG